MQTAFITQEAFRQVLLFFQFQPQSIRHLKVLHFLLCSHYAGVERLLSMWSNQLIVITGTIS